MANKIVPKGTREFTLSEYSKMLIDDPSILYKQSVAFTDEDENKTTLSDISTFIGLIISRKAFSSHEFGILKEVINFLFVKKVDTFSKEDLENLSIEAKMIITILINKDNLANGVINIWGESKDDVISFIYLSIMNIYISSDEVEEMITDLINIDFTEMIRNINNTNWFISKFEDRPIYMKDLLLVFKIISDIYMNQESAMDFLMEYHKRYHTSYQFEKDVDVISDRYKKYITQENASCINYMIETIGGDPDSLKSEKAIVEECDQFIGDCGDILKDIPQNILQCLIKDCVQVLMNNPYLNPDQSRFTIATQRISSKMKDYVPSEETPFVFPLKGYQDSPIEALEKLISEEEAATEALHKDSVAMNNAEKKIYKAYRTYKESEEKVDSQITKAVKGMGKVAMGDIRTEVIEGKKFSVIGLLKRVLATVGLFSIGPVKAVIALVIRYALKKKITESERRKIIMELDTEIEMITEKIEDARGDNNREAKYAMMRTKKELENAKKRIQYGMEASEKDLSNANKLLTQSREGGVS